MIFSRNLNKIVITVLTMFFLPYIAKTQDTEKITIIYLVRHAEKELNTKDPILTACGVERAESFAHFFEKIKLDEIYSTKFKRTVSTAEPTAKAKKLEIKTYDPRNLQEFAKSLLKLKKDVLVVGHSNTTPVLAGLLIGKDIKEINDTIYDRIYQVVLYKGKGRLHLFQSSFKCKQKDL
jgi:broad specificity phosphatase PhoE